MAVIVPSLRFLGCNTALHRLELTETIAQDYSQRAAQDDGGSLYRIGGSKISETWLPLTGTMTQYTPEYSLHPFFVF
jgi:hypothetical protein